MKQAEFIGYLAESQSVADAARRVGMTRESAYRLRRREWAGGFNAAWDAAKGLDARAERQMRASREAFVDINGPQPLEDHEGHEDHGFAASKVTFRITVPELRWRAEVGLYRPFLRGGFYAGYRHRVDNDALLQLIA